MAFVEPIQLEARGVRLIPLGLEHEAGLRAAAADGQLWNIRVTSVPEPEQTRKYIEDALAMRQAGNRFAFVVLDADGKVLAYCRSGTRSIVTWSLSQATSGAMDRGDLAALGRAAGYDLSGVLGV